MQSDFVNASANALLAYKVYKKAMNLRGSRAGLSPTMKNTLAIKRLQRQVKRNTGELKLKEWSFQQVVGAGAATFHNLTQISQGDNIGERDGHHIDVYGYELRVHSNSVVMDNIFVISKSGILPVYADFQPNYGGMIVAAKSHEFKELWNFRNYTAPYASSVANNEAGEYTHHSRKFKKPVRVAYDGSGAATCIKNALIMCLINHGTVGHTVTVNARVYYRDQ